MKGIHIFDTYAGADVEMGVVEIGVHFTFACGFQEYYFLFTPKSITVIDKTRYFMTPQCFFNWNSYVSLFMQFCFLLANSDSGYSHFCFCAGDSHKKKIFLP